MQDRIRDELILGMNEDPTDLNAIRRTQLLITNVDEKVQALGEFSGALHRVQEQPSLRFTCRCFDPSLLFRYVSNREKR